jgi:hypothetical protein
MSHVLCSRSRLQQLVVSGLIVLAPAVVACSGNKSGDEGNSVPNSNASAGKGLSPTGAVGGGGTSGAASSSSGAGGAPVTGTAGALTAGGASNASGAPGTAGQGGAAQATHDHCVYGYDPHPSDATMKDGPAEFYPAGKTDPSLVDLTVQPEVLSWMQSHFWQAAHVEWHAIRTCSLPGGPRGSKVNICQFTDMIPVDQNCQSTGDGYQFLLFHRHMLEALKQLWPKHSEQFSAFPKFPQSAEDVPAQWRSAWKPFNATDLANAKIAEEIDKPENLALFPDEGALGFWLQCNMGASIKGFNLKSSGLHGDLHMHWVRQGNTEHGLGNTSSNIDNYMFWKLHGWMDNVWEKYRVAKGLKRTDPKYVDDMRAQCREMDIEAEFCRTGIKPGQMTEPLPVESGFFHEKVRPIFEAAANKCSGCHSAAGPEAGLSLGGQISSKDIVAALVNQQAIGGGQFKRVVPGKPEQSWLYLKITAMTSSCSATSAGQCFPGPMPPSADGKTTVSADDVAIVRQWIMDGAPGPK